jgi:hypothetical protein
MLTGWPTGLSAFGRNARCRAVVELSSPGELADELVRGSHRRVPDGLAR